MKNILLVQMVCLNMAMDDISLFILNMMESRRVVRFPPLPRVVIVLVQCERVDIVWSRSPKMVSVV